MTSGTEAVTEEQLTKRTASLFDCEEALREAEDAKRVAEVGQAGTAEAYIELARRCHNAETENGQLRAAITDVLPRLRHYAADGMGPLVPSGDDRKHSKWCEACILSRALEGA